MLPITTKYKIVESYYTGGIEVGCETCANCGRVITNVAVISDEVNTHHVGMDCAETLCSDEFVFGSNPHAQAFSELKRIMAKTKKSAKTEPNSKLVIQEYPPVRGYYKQGGFLLTFDCDLSKREYFCENLPIQYLPYIKSFVELFNSKIK